MNSRTWLFVPGDRPERFHRALESSADEVIVDLEDAVTPEAKASARQSMNDWLSDGGRAWVRINGAETPWWDEDLNALTSLRGLRGVMVPKSEDADLLRRLAHESGFNVVALVETARGVREAAEIAQVPGVTGLAFGALDFALDVGCSDSDAALAYARGALVVAARACRNVDVIDSVCTSIREADIVSKDARRTREMGFDGKLCIHPNQITPVREAFAPTLEELAWAKETLVRADGSRGAVLAADGTMIDLPVISRARSIIADAEAAGGNEEAQR